MRLRSFVVTVLALSLMIFFACQRKSTPGGGAVAPTTATTASVGPNLEKITVKIRTTGIASLVEGADPAKQRILVIPPVSAHDLLVLIDRTVFTIYFPTDTADQTDANNTVLASYKFGIYPDGYEVDLAASGWIAPQSPALVFDTTGDSASTPEACPNDTSGGNVSPNSLHWLPRMSYVNRDPVKAKATHVKKDPKSTDVLARIDMTDGKLEAETRSKRKFEFDTAEASGDHVQVLADYLVYTFDAWIAPGQPFVLRGRKFNPSGGADEWKEIARVKPFNKTVSITLANVVKNDFFKPKPVDESVHFHEFYNALDGPKRNIVKVKYKADCPVGPGDDGLECGPNRVP
jgi:hypothetical protein